MIKERDDKKTFYIALGIVGGSALAVLSGKLDLIFKSAFWVVLGFVAIYVLMKMWKSVNKKEEEDKKKEEKKP